MVDKKDIERISIISQLNSGLISNKEAASTLNLSARIIQRLKRKANEHGNKAILHGNRGKKAHNAIPDEVKEQIINLVSNEFKNTITLICLRF